jgi:integrase
MASVYKRVRPREGKPDLITWETRWYGLDRRQKRKSFPRKADAERYRAEIETRMATGSYADPSRARVLLGDFAEQWLAGRVRLKPKTVEGYRSLLDNRVLPRWGALSLDRIGYEDVQAWVAETSATASPSTTRQAYHLLSSILNDAVKARRLSANPASGVELPRLPRTSRRYLTHEQVADLAEACGDYELVVLTLAYTGIRWGELAAIRVGRLALGARRIHIEESMVEVGGVAIYGAPKSHADRWVAVPTFMREPLLALAAGRQPDELLFTSAWGRVLRVNNFRRSVFNDAAASVGLAGLVPHELRHTAASLAIQAGANVKGVQTMLGHASAQLTLDRYSHLFDDAVDTVADKLDAAHRDMSLTRSRTIPSEL